MSHATRSVEVAHHSRRPRQLRCAVFACAAAVLAATAMSSNSAQAAPVASSVCVYTVQVEYTYVIGGDTEWVTVYSTENAELAEEVYEWALVALQYGFLNDLFPPLSNNPYTVPLPQSWNFASDVRLVKDCRYDRYPSTTASPNRMGMR